MQRASPAKASSPTPSSSQRVDDLSHKMKVPAASSTTSIAASSSSSASSSNGPPSRPARRHRHEVQDAQREGGDKSTSMAPSSSTHVGNYHLGDCLGRGAFGSVYRGLNWMTGETVAVKQIRTGNMSKGDLREIMAEIDLLKNLKHPNIVKYKGSEKTREHLFIILEYCENGSLQHICKRFGKFPEGLVGVYVSQVLDGLIYLHDQGVIHRDIKGANILTNKDGSVKLADFGVATRVGSLLANNAVVGSPYWMAPEVIDQSGATTASDVWSVGAVVIELLEGKPPYHYLDPMPALFRIVQDDCPPLPDGASPAVKDFLMHCFQKDANFRISAKKLSRHPWMLSAKRQLEHMRTGGSVQSSHAEAVKSVKEWNEAIKAPAKTGLLVKDGKGLPFQHRVLPGEKIRSWAKGSGKESEQNDKLALTSTPLLQASESTGMGVSSTPSAPIIQRERRDNTSQGTTEHEKSPWKLLLHLSESPPTVRNDDEEKQVDNWDDDFEEGIATDKLTALDHNRSLRLEDHPAEENEDNFATIRPSPKNVNKHMDEQPPAILDARRSAKGLFVETPSLSGPEKNSAPESPEKNSALSTASERRHLSSRAQFSSSETLLEDVIPPLDPRSLSNEHPTSESIQELNLHSERYDVRQGETSLIDYAEGDDDEDYSDLVIESSDNQDIPRLQLVQRHSTTEQWPVDGDEEADEEHDPFSELEGDDIVGTADLQANIARDKHARMCAHTLALFERLSVHTAEDELIAICDELELILTEESDMKAHALAAHGALTIIELLETIQIRDVASRLLGLLNVIIYQDAQAQENLCLIGAIPVVMPFCSKRFPHHVRIEAAHFIFSMCSSSTLTLQFVLSCRGLKTLVELVDEEYSQQKNLVWLGVACVHGVLELQSPASRNDFCRMLANEGLLEPLSSALLVVVEDEEHIEQVALAKGHILQIFLIYSASEAWLKQQIATRSVLRRLLQACRFLEPTSLIKMLKVLKNLTMSPTTLDEVENCNTIEVLINILARSHSGSSGTEISNQILNAMYNLCRLNVRRQEEAAQAGLIPHLLRVAKTSNPLKHFALPILCELAHASKSTRKMLSQQCGISFFLQLLHDPNWQLQSLESICVWLQGDLARIEDQLLRPDAVKALLHVFVSSKSLVLENMLETLLKIFKLSSGITLALGKQSIFLKRLADRLQAHSKTIVRLNLLRICKAICDVHPDIHALMRQFGLPGMIQRLANDDGPVLVRELAREIASQLLRPSVVPSLVAKDAHRTVRRAASESNVAMPVNTLKSSPRPHRHALHSRSRLNEQSMPRSTTNRS